MAETASNAVEAQMDRAIAEPATAQPLVREAATATPIARPVSAEATATARTRRQKTAISGGVVPPGTLARNAHHPLRALRPEQRNRAALEALGRLVLRMRDRP
jgi:hypothetical protein